MPFSSYLAHTPCARGGSMLPPGVHVGFKAVTMRGAYRRVNQPAGLAPLR